MAIIISVPRLGWSMDEGMFTQWLKAAGEYVQKGDMLFVLEGDKAAQEIESFDEGVLCIPPDAPQPGDVVEVGQTLGFLLEKNEAPPASVKTPAAQAAEQCGTSTVASAAASGTVSSAVEAAASVRENTGLSSASSSGASSAGAGSVTGPRSTLPRDAAPARSSPRARRRASELGIDWTRLAGTGRDGRVRTEDVERAAAEKSHAGSNTAPAVQTLRRTIAERLSQSHREVVPVTLTTSVDATKLVEFRHSCRNFGVQVIPSYQDMLVRLCARLLPQHRGLNARWSDGRVQTMQEINIGIAVDTEHGLMVPVIHHADQLSVEAISAKSAELVESARARRLDLSQLQGGTFTISNLGAFGIDAFTPVVNLPECAILGIGRIARAPVVRDEQLAIGHQLTLSLTFDHRVLDGAPAARFLQDLSRQIESGQ